MNEIFKTELIDLLAKQTLTTNCQLGEAYEEFTEIIEKLNQPDESYQTVYRALNLTRIELAFLSKHFRDEQGEKCA